MTARLSAVARALGRLQRGDLAVLTAAVAVAVAASSTVGFYTDRLERGIRLDSATVLAADLRLESGRSASSLDGPERDARRRGLQTGRTVSLTSVVHANGQDQLATVLASDGGYPLRGALRVGTVAYGPARTTVTLPSPGEAYADPRLMTRLGIGVGDRVALGATTVTVGGVLADRPDRGSGFAEIAPALLVRPAALSASGLLGPTSRATFTLLVAGASAVVDAYGGWLRQHKAAAERVVDVAQSSAQLGSAAERAGRFLRLATVTTVLLASIALVMAARRYARQRRDEVALLKCLGATRRTILVRFAGELGGAAAVGGVAGLAAGLVAQWGLARIASVWTGLAVLPGPGWLPGVVGLVTAFAMVAGFGLPPVLELARVPPVRVLREDASPRALPVLVPAAMALCTLLALLYLDVRDLRLTVGAGVALVTVLTVYGAIAAGVVALAGRIASDGGRVWRYAVASLARRRVQSIAQWVAFGLSLTLLLLIGVVRRDLLTEWRNTVPRDAPNYFLLNVAPDERDAVARFLTDRGAQPQFAPWVRARLVSVNGVPMANRMPTTDRGRAFAEREQNLSFSVDLPRDNRLVAGHWWPSGGATEPSVSIASEFRDELGLRLGDRLDFDLAGEPLEVTVASVRQVRWDGFRPNFFLLLSPGLLDDRVGSFLGAVHLDGIGRQALGAFNRRFPTVTVLDLDGLLSTVRQLIDRAADAVSYVFAFTLCASLVVVHAAIRTTEDERRFEGALLRTLGATRQHLWQVAAAEFATLGALAGLCASAVAALLGEVVAVHWLGVVWRPGLALWLWGTAGGCLLVGLAGVMGVGSLSATPPARTLRGG